jgi:hypothetical protein
MSCPATFILKGGDPPTAKGNEKVLKIKPDYRTDKKTIMYGTFSSLCVGGLKKITQNRKYVLEWDGTGAKSHSSKCIPLFCNFAKLLEVTESNIFVKQKELFVLKHQPGKSALKIDSKCSVSHCGYSS